MDTDAGVRKLMELIFGKKPTIPKEMAAHSSIPTSLLSEDFLNRLANVLKIRRFIINGRWKNYFDSNFRKILLSHMSYVRFLLSSCLFEKKSNENIFDSFISVCALLLYLSEETLSKVQVNFRDLNPDIFIVFFRNEFRSSFSKREDLNRLVEYIRDHKYLKWLNDFNSPAPQEQILENIRKEIDSYEASENVSHGMVCAMKVTVAALALDVLSSTSVKLPDLPGEVELTKRLVAYRKREEVNEAEKKRKVETISTLENSHRQASLGSDFKTDFPELEENIARHERIIETVIRHNHSKNYCNEIASNQSLEEANGILKHLESKIKSLVEVLDDL